MYGVKLYGEMFGQVSVVTYWYHGLTCLGGEMYVRLSQGISSQWVRMGLS